MADIKIKENRKGTIKTLNKAVIGTEKIKNRLVGTKEKINKMTQNNETNSNDYAINKITDTTQNTPNNISRINKYCKKSFNVTRENVYKVNQKIKYAKKRQHAKKVMKNMKRGTEKLKKTIKTAEKTGKNIKTSVRVIAKSNKKVIKITKETVKRAIQTIKMTIKATISAIKAIIAGTKALITAIIAGGWIVIVVVILICIIAMIISSTFGIFFSSENTNSTITINGIKQDITMNQVISELNIEFMNKITEIQQENPHDEYEITGQRAEWKDILSLYSVKIKGEDNENDVITINDEKVQILKDIFWEMNKISYSTEQRIKNVEVIDVNGNKATEEKEITMLNIIINGKSTEEMIMQFGFTKEQKEQLQELTDEKYASMWSAVIYGSSNESKDIVNVALKQIGNIGGQPYWSWYGFTVRVEWCACFVSWCANECGYINSGIIPKFASCQSEGVTWFKTCGLWQDRGYIPKARRYNIF